MRTAAAAFLLTGALSLSSALPAGDDELLIGATLHFQQRKGIVTENLKVFKDAGFISPRAGIWWDQWETKRGVYEPSSQYSMYIDYLDQTFASGLTPMQTLVCGNSLYQKGYPKSPEAVEAFAKFCENVVAKYKGKCHLYKIWNEWDGGCGVPKEFKGQGDAASYVRLAAAAYEKMKAVDPSITVVANSVCTGETFLEETLKEGILKHCDGIAFHAYHYNRIGDARMPEAYAARIEKVAELLKSYNGGKEFPLYLTETGWPNYTKRGGSTEEETGDYIARTYLLIKTIPSVKGLWWYDFQDDGLDPEYSEDNFGIVRTDLTPKPAFYVMRSIAEIARKGKFVERLKSEDDSLVALKFKMPDGQDVLAAWNTANEVNMSVTLKNSIKPNGLLKTFVAGYEPLERAWGMRDWVAKRDAPFLPDRFQFTAKSRPYMIMGDLSGVSIEKVKRIAFPEMPGVRRGSAIVPEKIGSSYPSGKASPMLPFGGPTNYRSLSAAPASDAKGLDASFRLSWEKDALLLVVEVNDDVFCQTENTGEMWRGDSVQVAFQSLDKKANGQTCSEYTLALTGKGPVVYRECSQLQLPAGVAKDIALDVKRDGSKTVYAAKFPVQELGFPKLAGGTLFGFSLLVNDNDGTGRKGYLHWGDGIGNSKDPSAYNWIRIEE